jgi:hypothetical protein
MPHIGIEIVFCVMRWPHIDLGAQNLNGFNGQNHFKKIAGSKVLDEYYNFYLSPIPALKYTTDPLKTLTISLF